MHQPPVTRGCWVSWVGPRGDYRPITTPVDPKIVGWWCSGESGDGNAILCAFIDAGTADEAREIVNRFWPEFGLKEWRFCIVDHPPPRADRFPPMRPSA